MVWAIRKCRHIVESAALPMQVFTDHGAITGIVRQRSLETESIDRANIGLVRASNYLQQFNLDVYHKPGREHIVPDALSRLLSVSKPAASPELDFDLASAFNFTATLVQMSDEFRAQLQDGYLQDPVYASLLKHIQANDKLGDDRAELPFSMTDGLIFHEGDTQRLCIPESMVGKVLTIAHTDVSHPGFHRTFQRAHHSWYIKSLAKHVKKFINHCPECKVNQTRRHAPYGSLQPIPAPLAPFHTISIDFILALPLSYNDYNCVISVTYNMSKHVTLIPGKDTWTAA
jgi:Integrase zinc binding domain